MVHPSSSTPPMSAAVVEITRLIAGSPNADAPLAAVAEHLVTMLAHTALRIWQWQDARLCCIHQHGSLGSALPDPDPISAAVARTGQPVMSADEAAASGLVASAGSGVEERSVMSAPLRAPQAVIGALTVYRPGDAPFQADDRLVLEAFAGLVTIALLQAQLHQATQARAAALARLQQISLVLNADLHPRRIVEQIIRTATDLTGALFSTVLLVDEHDVPQDYVTNDSQTADPIHEPASFRPHGTTVAILRSGKPLVIEDVATDERVSPRARARGLGAIIGLPLLVEDRVIGLLWVNFAQPRTPSPEEIRVLETLAAQAATALRNARLYDEARFLADHDPMTGLVNYRLLQERLRQELANARRSGESLSILMIDLNDFKQVNDTYGHLAGDALLRWVATALQQTCREGDTVGRYGGDEFLLVLPRTTAEGARMLAQRLVDATAHAHITVEGKVPVPRLAIGTATWPDDGQDATTLIARADRFLYRAKSSTTRRRPQRPPARRVHRRT